MKSPETVPELDPFVKGVYNPAEYKTLQTNSHTSVVEQQQR